MPNQDLFESSAREHFRQNAPLAERLRPTTLAAFAGQEQLIGPGRFLRNMIESDQISSMILWGPPGTGKTTLGRIIAAETDRRFTPISAVNSGVADIKRILAEARDAVAHHRRKTILFIDEIHRFNKAQQDALLHGVEDGTLTLIGATTENPSFEVNAALLSRMRVVVLKALDSNALTTILHRALTNTESGLGEDHFVLGTGAEAALLELAAGDARSLLNFIELASLLARSKNQTIIDVNMVHEAAGRRVILYDKTGEEHYNVISAFIKSIRGSDPDAAIYYLARMLEGGEDPKFIARRLVIFASEDIGNADPAALALAIACKESVAFIGMPEGYYPLSQCTVYLACAEKSNASGRAYGRAMEDVKRHGALPVPLHLRNATTGLMREQGYGQGYESPHDQKNRLKATQYLPDKIANQVYYRPRSGGTEKTIKDKLQARTKKDQSTD